jgi:hypothetical protein
MLSDSLLTLNWDTLYYFNHNRHDEAGYSGHDLIKVWADATEPGSKPPSMTWLRPPSVACESFTVGSTRSSKISATSSKSTMVDADIRMGGISDNEEVDGPEREFAVKSPLKGKKRLTSAVRFNF